MAYTMSKIMARRSHMVRCRDARVLTSAIVRAPPSLRNPRLSDRRAPPTLQRVVHDARRSCAGTRPPLLVRGNGSLPRLLRDVEFHRWPPNRRRSLSASPDELGD